MFFRYRIFLIYRYIWGDGACACCDLFLARRVRTDQRRDEGVGAGGKRLGSSATDVRSLHVDCPIDVELTQGGAARSQQLGGLSRREERRGLAAGVSSGYTAAGKTMCGEFECFPHPRGLFGSGNGDHALPYRYPLS
jgi:hypothetical protein